MPDERKTPDAVKERIREIETELELLRTELNVLKKDSYADILEELRPMIGKCFRKVTYDGSLGKVWKYTVIIGLPEIETNRFGVTLNPYYLPAINFRLAEDFVYPFEGSNCSDEDDVFFYDSVFIGNLPSEYKRGARPTENEDYVEISKEIFMDAARVRFSEFLEEIFFKENND